MNRLPPEHQTGRELPINPLVVSAAADQAWADLKMTSGFGKAAHEPRRRRSPLVTALTVAIIAMSVGIQTPSPAGALTCSDVEFVAVRGSGEAQNDQWGGMGEVVNATWQSFSSSLSGKRSITPQPLQYPAASTNIIFWNWVGVINYIGVDYLQSINDGVSELQTLLNAITTRCNSWIVLVGYSQGALVIRKALTGVSDLVKSRIGGIALFGDPARHDSGDGLDHFGGAQNGGTNGVWEVPFSKIADAPRGRGFAGSWCLPGDPICGFTAASLAKTVAGLGNAHFQYKTNGMAQTAGYWLAEDLLKLPSTPVTPSNPPPAPTPTPPAGVYVSTCNLGGADHCTGVNLRSVPQYPGNVIGGLPEWTVVRPVCWSPGTLIHDAQGASDTRWAYVTTGSQSGFVNFIYLFGDGFTIPWCDPVLSGNGSSSISGPITRLSSARFVYPLKNDGTFDFVTARMVIAISGPNGAHYEAPCNGGGAVRIAGGSTLNCVADFVIPTVGHFDAWLTWQKADGSWTDGTPDWTQRWSSWLEAVGGSSLA